MPPIPSSSKAAARLLYGRRYFLDLGKGPGLLKRCPERFTSVRRSSTIAFVGKPSVGRSVDGVLSSLFGKPLRTTQARGFLGCGDGEEGDVLSKMHEERRVIGYSPEQLFAVVAAVDLYEDFLPWCQRSRIISRNSDGSFDAELEIGFKFLVESYVSHTELKKAKYIKTTTSKSGLFDHLISSWEFNPGPVLGSCDLYFLVDFKFQSPLYHQVASMFFKEVVPRIVSSFNDRCRKIYGPAIQLLENSYGQSL